MLPEKDWGLMLVTRVDDALVAPPERSWTLPCEYCGKVCYVDPDALFGTSFVGLTTGEAVRDFPRQKKLCCLRCVGAAGEEADNFDEADRKAMHNFARKFAVAIDAYRRKRRLRR